MKKQEQKTPKFSQALRRLPQQARVGCVAIAVERALEEYSSELKNGYQLNDAIEAAWDFVRKGSRDSAQDDRLADAISDELTRLDGAGYAYDHGLMAISLVLGFSRPASLQAAVEYAGRVWALGPGASPAERERDPDGLKGPVYVRLLEAIETCKAGGGTTPWEKLIRGADASPASAKKTTKAKKPAKKPAKKVTRKSTRKKPGRTKTAKPAKATTKKKKK